MRSVASILLASLLATGESFAPSTVSFSKTPISSAKISKTQLHFFWNKKDEEKKPEEIKDDGEEEEEKAPFFANFFAGGEDDAKAQDNVKEDAPALVTATATTVEAPPPPAPVPPPPPPVKKPPVPEDPVSKAKALRAHADRLRLESEKMDAELTLSKISRLEKDVAAKQKKGESTEDLLREMDILQRKMRGEPPLVVPVEDVSTPATTTTTDVSKSKSSTSSSTLITSISSSSGPKTAAPTEPVAPFSQEEFDKTLSDFDNFPSYLRVLLARSVGLQPMSARDVNATEYAVRSEKQGRLDFSFVSDISPPSFSAEEIAEFKKSFDEKEWKANIPEALEMKELADDETILQAMKEEYYFKEITKKYGVSKGMAQGFLSGSLDDAESFSAVIEAEMDRSQPYSTIEGLFPKCVEKEGQIPTESQVKMLMSDVLPQAGFKANSQPVEVFGGYLIRGESKKDEGDDLIDAIDASLAKNPMLRDKFTISYIKDLTAVMGVSDDDFESAMLSNLPRSLYVMGPDVSRDRNRLLLAGITSLGLASSWYLSIYPFLINPTIMKRAEEQMQLADSSMSYDLTFLTDLSIPLFATFMGLQVAHELGHRVAAASYGLNVTLPTFVPSLASGITSAITNLKEPAKNREQLFDFAIAGPLTGMVFSLLALYAGLELTVATDASTLQSFPALPLEILRQSSLGGGLIEGVLGNGYLSIPEAARGTEAVASINIPLHPVAIAGYISLIVNALSLLPIGTTDGGRVSQAVFNRAGKQIVGQIFLLTLFAIGILGDDLFLFYGFFCSFFSQGSEIPQRNEVDDISFSRVLFATAVGVVALLSIIPMQ